MADQEEPQLPAENPEGEQQLLRATHASDKTPLRLGNVEIPCYVLEGGIRVLSGRAIQRALGYEGNSGEWLRDFVFGKTLSQHLPEEISAGFRNPLKFERIAASGSQPETYGFEATLLIDLCDALMDMKSAGVLKPNQLVYAEQAEMIIRSVAKVGIIALVDEVTGFQEVRPLDALQKYLDEFLLQEHAKWTRRFPPVFFQLLFQMMGWQWNALSTKKPQYIGKMINNLVYERLGPKVLQELRERNPANEKGNRTAKHHQFLTENIGHPKLQEHLASLVALLRASGCNRGVFNRMVDVALPRFGHTIPLLFGEPEEIKPPAARPTKPKAVKPDSKFDAGLKGLLSIPPPPKPEKRKKKSKDEKPEGDTPPRYNDPE